MNQKYRDNVRSVVCVRVPRITCGVCQRYKDKIKSVVYDMCDVHQKYRDNIRSVVHQRYRDNVKNVVYASGTGVM